MFRIHIPSRINPGFMFVKGRKYASVSLVGKGNNLSLRSTDPLRTLSVLTEVAEDNFTELFCIVL